MNEALSETVNEDAGLLDVLESAIGGALSQIRKGTRRSKEILGMPIHLNVSEDVISLLDSRDSEDDEPLYI